MISYTLLGSLAPPVVDPSAKDITVTGSLAFKVSFSVRPYSNSFTNHS